MPYKEVKKSVIYVAAKRLLDIICATILLIVFFPIIIAVTIIVKLTSNGPILADTPKRVGKGGILFKMLKFRSMVENAHEILRENPKYADLFDSYKKGSYKLKDDPRVTKIGKIIRKYSLDEIQQLINVLLGDMSLVGPRAYYPDELKEQQKKYPHTQDSVKVV